MSSACTDADTDAQDLPDLREAIRDELTEFTVVSTAVPVAHP